MNTLARDAEKRGLGLETEDAGLFRGCIHVRVRFPGLFFIATVFCDLGLNAVASSNRFDEGFRASNASILLLSCMVFLDIVYLV